MELRRPDPTKDIDETLALLQASDRAVYGGSDWTESELREEWHDLDLEQNAWLAVIDGRLAGVMSVYDVLGGRVLADGYVHPELTGRGVGNTLLVVAEARALELTDGVEAEEVRIEVGHLVGDARAPMLFSGRGYRHARTFYRMAIDLPSDLPEPTWPDGIELRPLDVARDGAVLQATVDEAFVDEWGYERRDFRAWSQRVFGVERFDPELFLLAWDGDELAAVSLNYPKRMGDWGWIGTLAVRPAWRRRGIGAALLQEGFRRFAELGETVVALGVDSENPSGATRLYERAGMRVLWRADVWRKVLRPAG